MRGLIFSHMPRWLLWLAPVLFLGAFLLVPLVFIFRIGFSTPDHGFSWNDILPVLWFTVWQAGLSVFLTFVLGLPGAYLFARWDFPGKRLFRILTFLPFILPTMATVAGLEAWLGPNGWVNGFLSWAGLPSPIPFHHTLGAILIAHIFYNTAVVLRVVGSAWERLDLRLEESARILGAGKLQTFLHVSLPLLMPSITAAGVLVFFFDFSSFGVVLLLGGPSFATLEVEIYRQTMNLLDLRAAALLTGVQLFCTALLSVISTQLSARAESYFAYRPNFQIAPRLRTARQMLGGGAMLGFLSAFLVLPLIAPIARSCLVEDGGRWILSFRYYSELWINRQGSIFYVSPGEAIRNSLLVGLATTILTLAMALPAAVSLAHPTTAERIWEPVWMLPLGTSAVVLGLGMLLAFGRLPFGLVASPILLPIAHSLVAFPFVVRSLRPALAAIPSRMREAAATLGATPWQVWRTVDFPLAARAIASASAFAFAISLGEFGATALISRPDFPTLPVVIYRFLSQPGGLNYGQAMATTTILLALCALSVALMDLRGETNARTS